MEFYAGDETASGYELTEAVLIYRKGEEYICTRNRIRDDEVQAGVPIDLEELLRLATAGEMRKSLPRILPRNLICCDGRVLCWWKPEHKAPIFFKNKELSGISGKAIVYPNLLFAARKGSLQIFVVTELNFSEKTPLYSAPFYNMWDDGRLCLPEGGTVGVSAGDIEANERLFFESYFSHPDATNLTFCPGGLTELMKRLAKGETIRKEWLKGSGKTLGDILKEL